MLKVFNVKCTVNGFKILYDYVLVLVISVLIVDQLLFNILKIVV